MSTPAATLPKPPPRPYRRFLNSALHKRFVHAALISLLVALNNAFWLGPRKDLFWSWFPFGPAGLRALLFSISSLLVFFVQIATLKIGKHTTISPFAFFRSVFVSGAALQTTIGYLASGWWFTEVYIWSSPDLDWITRGTHNTPDVLNERPIFFRLYALLLALAFAGIHLYQGRSSLLIPVSKLPTTPNADPTAQKTHPVKPIAVQLQRKLISSLKESGYVAGLTMLTAPFINGFFFRNLLWQLHLAIAKPFFNLSRANARPIGYPPLGLLYLCHCLLAGFLLVLTWELTSTLFLTYLNQEPTKSGVPLSANSKDPNRTLLNGLKAKRDTVKTFAFWELAIIAQRHKDRRMAIFEDIEHPTGPMWSQMVQTGLTVLQELQLRIIGPPPPPPPAQPTKAEQDKSLPRLLPELQSQSIFDANAKPTRAEWFASPLKQFGSTDQPWRPAIEQSAKSVESRMLEYAKPPGPSQGPSKSLVDQWMSAIKQTSIGWLFTTTGPAQINATVLGSPYGNAATIVDVIEALTKMQVASLAEDTYGKATPTVPGTVRTFTKTLTLIEDFVSKNKQGAKSGTEDVEIIIERLRASLKELLLAFQVYLIDQGLGIADLNQAKRAIRPSKTEPSREKPNPNSAEQQTKRKLFQEDKERERPREKQRLAEERRPRIQEPLAWGTFPGKATNAPLFQKREMEQVR